MSRISILVATTSPDIKAEVIAASVAKRPDMRLLKNRVVPAAEIDETLNSLIPSSGYALVLVGRPNETIGLAERFLGHRADVVILQVDVVGDHVRIDLRDPRLEALLSTLTELVQRMGTRGNSRIARVQLDAQQQRDAAREESLSSTFQRPLLQAAINWVHAVLRQAVELVSDENGDAHGFSLTRATLLQLLDTRVDQVHSDDATYAALERALVAAAPEVEPLAAAYHAFELGLLEFKLLLLALAPELDARYQRCAGFLLDDMSRRLGTLGLYCGILGDAAYVRTELARSGDLWQSFALDSRVVSADEPLRVDPLLAQWLLGDESALLDDPQVRRAIRLESWPGASILKRAEESTAAADLLEKLRMPNARWIVLGGDDPAGWRAILELGAARAKFNLIRIELSHLAGAELIELEDCAKRIGRMARLTGNLLIVDVANSGSNDGIDEHIGHFITTLNRMGCRGAVLCRDHASIVRQLDGGFEAVYEPPLSQAGRASAVRIAAAKAGAQLTEEQVDAISNRFPLSLDRLEHAMHLALTRTSHDGGNDAMVKRFTTACRELAVEGLSHLAERVEPVFRLNDVVLPAERKRQLVEITDHVRLASKVLDGWKFRDQLPYGRGVTALFFGPSGTGKTMAALGIANELGIQLLRVDLSRVVSKYIGDTEKNIDRIFDDAQRSGSAILFDEAEALLGKRSEVKDAHDRYANIEVAYVLQRMEAYDGLAILTTNMRQNLDAAFLRRLRFVVDFPRPDVAAREQIWRFCMPAGSHELDSDAFRQLARKIDLTGGHIRQISLRAAFSAAAENVQINLAHIVDAATAEFAKLGMPPAEIDLSDRRAA